MKKLLLPISLLVAILVVVSCGGGGGGGSGAGDQSVLTTFNATTASSTLDTTVDAELISTAVAAGKSSPFESVLAGDRLVNISEVGGAQRSLELQNNFALGIPYTIVVVDSGATLAPIVAVNNRGDTPPAQFRIRAINASSRAGSIVVRLVPGTIGKSSQSDLALRATTPVAIGTATISPIVSPTATAKATTTSLATVTPTSVATTPGATPTPQASATVSATPSSIPPTAAPISNVVVANDLQFRAVGDYQFVQRGDYRIVVESSGVNVPSTGVITYAGGQTLTILIRDATSAEGNGAVITRLNDVP